MQTPIPDLDQGLDAGAEGVPSAHRMQAGPGHVPGGSPRRAWGKKLSPMEASALFRDYNAGAPLRTLQEKYGVGKSTLYRWIREMEEPEERRQDATFLRARIASLEHCVAMLALRLTGDKEA